MPRLAHKTCKRCGKSSADVGPLSWTRLCGDCSYLRLAENIEGLATHSGTPIRRWREGMAASVGAILLDDGHSAP